MKLVEEIVVVDGYERHFQSGWDGTPTTWDPYGGRMKGSERE